MCTKELLAKKRFMTDRVVALVIPLLIATGVLGITGRCSSPKTELPSPLSQTITAPAVALSKSLVAVSNHVKPAVVTIESEQTVRQQPVPDPQLDGNQQKPIEQKIFLFSSGMIIDKSGYVLTNQHVVLNADEVKVTLPDKREFKAKVVSTNQKADVAIIRIEDRARKYLPCVRFGNSDLLHVGELVMAIGAPYTFTQTVTTGIISTIGRSVIGFPDSCYLQTDASMHIGNSGGPLINMRGEVIGLNTALWNVPDKSHAVGGITFAIPINIIKSMLPALIKGEKLPE